MCDGTVAACYDWLVDLGDEEMLVRLLALNGERIDSTVRS